MNSKNPDLNAAFEELTRVLEKIGFGAGSLNIEIAQHECSEKQATQLMESITDNSKRLSYGEGEEATHWFEARLNVFPREIRISCFYYPDKEESHDPSCRSPHQSHLYLVLK